MNSRTGSKHNSPEPNPPTWPPSPIFDIADVLVHTRKPLAELEALDTPNTRRAAELLTKRAVADTVKNPPAPLVAVIGERDPQRADLWDQAAGQYAVYNLRWNAQPVDGQIAPALTDTSPPRQQTDHQQLHAAIVDVRADNNRHLTAPELAHARRQLVDDLTALRPVNVDYQNGVARQLEHKITRLTNDREKIEQTLIAASTKKALKKDPNEAEAARRFIADTDRQLDVARAHLADIAATQQRAPRVAAQRDRASTELAVIDRLIHQHVETALAEPQPYRTQVLGERPTDPCQSQTMGPRRHRDRAVPDRPTRPNARHRTRRPRPQRPRPRHRHPTRHPAASEPMGGHPPNRQRHPPHPSPRPDASPPHQPMSLTRRALTTTGVHVFSTKMEKTKPILRKDRPRQGTVPGLRSAPCPHLRPPAGP